MPRPKIDVSLTSISSRMGTICETLQSILDQDYDGELQLHLHLSPEPYLLDAGVPTLPRALQALKRRAGERLQIHEGPNFGPYRKLLPYLHRNWGLSKLVVTADDDTIYPADWLRGLVDAYLTYGCVIASRGHRIIVKDNKIAPYRSWMGTRIDENPSHFILPTGKDGILYNTAFFPIGVLNIEEALKLAPTADDLWFRWHLAASGVQTFILNMDYRSSTFVETDYESSLYLNFNRGGANDVAIASLETHFEESFGFTLGAISAGEPA
ncbi:hypothetical protein BKE38_22270 [Pseudoroseomonas deserti]|uniref:Glycosyltransferase 2-like domain-containing protein n=1 Tax=Teichococcus deserti TaxID=1817963 RepID=A0A1V2GYX0_9PROT|nr:glycosyltransferase family A protein [Pseudoroseomonas deserti]ONG48219.1 hypothetical protein BKE38_22270 [Pseudoroseomonas deserti]